MKCEFSREKLVGFFYDELAADERAGVEEHLSGCSSCRKEVKQLTQTTNLLQAWPDESPQLNLRFVAEPARHKSRLRNVVSRRVGIGLAAGAAAALLLLALMNFEASYAHGNLSVKLSLFPQQSQPVMAAHPDSAKFVTQPQFDAWQAEHVQFVRGLLADLETRQRRDNRLLLTDLVENIERQRQQDLRVVGKGLEAVQLSSENRLRRTNAVLSQLIMQTSYPEGSKQDSSRDN